MPVAGLVVTLSCAGAQRAALLEKLEGFPGVTVGPRNAAQLAMVLETGTIHAQRAAWEELSALPGVADIQLAYAHVDDSYQRDEDPKATHRQSTNRSIRRPS